MECRASEPDPLNRSASFPLVQPLLGLGSSYKASRHAPSPSIDCDFVLRSKGKMLVFSLVRE